MRWTTALHAHFVHAVELLGGHENVSNSEGNDGRQIMCCRMLASAGSPVGKQEVSWCLQPPFAQQSGMPLPLPCPYLMSAHHNRYLLSQNQGWRRGQDAASHVQLGQDNIARRLHAGQHADTAAAAAIRRSSCSAGVESRWSSSSNGRSSSTEQACWMMNKQQPQQQRSSRVAVPNLEISLGRQGWHHNLQDQQQLRSGETAAAKELTLLKCL
nr:unnamed protein product [Digitaria exilis]